MTISGFRASRDKRLPAVLALAGVAALALAALLASAPAASADSCPNASARTGFGAELPDCRGYEQVTPPDKDNADIFVRAFPGLIEMQAADAGNSVVYTSLSQFAGAPINNINYLGARGASWSTTPLGVPQSNEGALCIPEIQLSSLDLAQSMYIDGGRQAFGCGTDSPPIVPGEPVGVQNIFLRHNDTNTFDLVSHNPVAGPPADANPQGASPDLSNIVFDEAAQLTPDAPVGDNLYDWSGGVLKAVAVVGGTVQPGAVLGDGANRRLHAVSADGSRIFFTVNGNLYVRKNGATTSQLDKPDGGPGPGGGGVFMDASLDGTTAYFTDDAGAGLTPDTVPGSGTNLYAYDVPTGTLTDLTAEADAEVQGVATISADGSYVYFVANGRLTAPATAGAPNLFLYHAGATRFIATLDPTLDTCVWLANGGNCQSGTTFPGAKATPDGRHLVFNSSASLTGYDNTDAVTGALDTEVFSYDVATHALACASCNPSGAQPIGPSFINGFGQGVFGTLPWYVPRDLSPDGSRLVYTSGDALVPRDTNGRFDVYENEAGGGPSLISTGTDSTPSGLIDMSTSGDDIFFFTAQQLVSTDGDGAIDLYDARVGGGFPPPSTTPPCSGDGCKPPPSGEPAGQSPGTTTFHGQGNLKMKKITAAQAKRFARTGRLTISASVGGAGKVSAKLLARLHRHGYRAVSSDSKRAAAAGKVKLHLRLSKAAKRTLAKRGRLGVRIKVSFHAATKVANLTLKESH